MAITEKELEISNKSYTNKDFAAIYEELLTYATKLSRRFSPLTANESDPFIILLKLAAFVADKVNYNSDKELLERFILSCTQDQSMRELTAMQGYNMHYYNSAKTNIICKYNFTNETSNIEIPTYSIVTSISGIQYVTISRGTIDKNSGISEAIDVIQGELKPLTIFGNTKIQLENLNSNNILYFPELMIAENGVMIYNNIFTVDNWLKVTNLNDQVYGTPCYKFGYDSKKQLPYIEFPEWIADIINDGLTIYYIVTLGEAGNVMAKELTSIQRANISSVDNSIDDKKIIVTNTNAATAGSSPENIDEAYNSFKKIIGTFDNLVTCRDYANKIYSMLDNYTTPVVSNIQVSDRRTDINYSNNVVTMTENGVKTISVINTRANIPEITAYDLCLYGLTPITNFTYQGINKKGGYNQSYNALQNYDLITYRLENENKTLCHDYKTLATNDITLIKNRYKLNAIVNTTTKVNAFEQNEILININNALIKNYNPRNLNFGCEIPFADLLHVMESADSRIKSISLTEPEQTPEIKLYDNDTPTSEQKLNAFKVIIAKNIMSGRIALFDYYNDFNFDYNYTDIAKTENITKISTKCNITVPANPSSYTLKPNEVVQFLSPVLKTELSYPYGIYYSLVLSTGTTIPANTDYQLKANEYLNFTYTNTDGQICVDTYVTGDIINSKSALVASAARNAGTENHPHGILPGYNVNDFYVLDNADQVDYKKICDENLLTTRKCYWLTTNPDNEIIWDANGEYILKENEYFFHSDNNLTSLYAFGSGTKLTCTSHSNILTRWKCEENVTLDSINEEGLQALAGVFKTLLFTTTNSLNICENEIITLTAGDSLKLTTGVATAVSINVFDTMGDISIMYKHSTDADFIELPVKNLSTSANWKWRSLLDINAGPNNEQLLYTNQYIYYTNRTADIDMADNETYTGRLSENDYFKFNIPVQRGGGENINLAYETFTLSTQYPTLLKYHILSDSNYMLTKTANNYYTVNFSNTPGTADIYTSNIDVDFKRYVMIYTNSADSNITLTAYQTNTLLTASLTKINGETAATLTAADSIDLTEGINIIRIDSVNCNKLKLTKSDADNSQTIISPMKYVKGLNPLLGLTGTVDAFITYLITNFTEQFKKFYCLADIDNAKQIELSDSYKLDSAFAFYDCNNIANKWVLPIIDFEHNDIKIARNSIK